MTSLISLFHDRVAAEGQRTALRVKRDGAFAGVTWNQLADEVRKTAAALRSLGVQPGDRVVQVSENRYEWIVADLAVLMARAIHVAVHSTLSGPQIAFQINDCQPRLVLLSGQSQAEKLAGEDVPKETTYCCHDPCGEAALLSGRPIRRLRDTAVNVSDITAARIEREALDSLADDDMATILYTSGTTGEPKGVMLSHGNLRTNAEATLSVMKSEPGDVRLSWLPLSHVYARTCDYYLWIAAAETELALAESRETILADCHDVRPMIINGVPYFYDKLCRHLSEAGQADTPGVISQMLGGRIRFCCVGGAALPDHVAEFFNRQGLPLLQGYGLTESSPVISFSTDAKKVGSVGRPVPGVEVKIAEDGEILTRGPHVMIGYWKQPQETADAVRDGWLYTGDLGRLDDNGFLYISGRKKELIVTATGKNIAPVLIESLLSEDPLILQVVVIGDDRNYLTALIVPDESSFAAELARLGVEGSADRNLQDARVRKLFAERIEQRLISLSPHEQIGEFTLLREPFNIERDELTPTLKLRRRVIAERYAAEIEAMYAKK